MTWVYGEPPAHMLEVTGPSWECPDDICQCDLRDGEDAIGYVVVVVAPNGRRMGGARVRVHHRGRIVNEGMPHADAEGRVMFELPHRARSFFVEWAPAAMPETPPYPFRARYHAALGDDETERGQKRLANLGFWTGHSLEDNVVAFQERYGHPLRTGKLGDIAAQLAIFHDTGCPFVNGETSVQNVALMQEADDRGPMAPNLQPQTPLPAAPNQGTTQTPPPVQVDLVVDWGSRPTARGRRPSRSFWLQPQAVPVAVGIVPSAAGWHDATPSPSLAVAFRKATKTAAETTLPAGDAFVVVGFDLHVTIGGHTKSVLAFKQLFALDAAGELEPLEFAFEDYAYHRLAPNPYDPAAPAGLPPLRGRGDGHQVKGDFRVGQGLHPLLATGANIVPNPSQQKAGKRLARQLLVNAEMVDATDLWWALHPREDHEHYLHPALGGRVRHLRILAWTSGELPMIWFAVVPDAALTNTEREGGADIVFLRPPPAVNSFTHKPDAKAFATGQHHRANVIPGKGVSTLWMLARYLLSKQSLAELQQAGITNSHTLQMFSKAIWPSTFRNDATGAIVPSHPAENKHISGFLESFRACGWEEALDAARAPHVLLLPLASENDGYPGALRPGLKRTVESAFLCLWNQCAVARDIPKRGSGTAIEKPKAAARELWVAGHSAGNIQLAVAVQRNAKEISRVMSFGSEDGALDGVQRAVANAMVARKNAGLDPMDVILVTSPDMTKRYQPNKRSNGKGVEVRGVSMDVARAGRFFATGARITCLPAFDQQRRHYTLAPVAEMNPVLRELVGHWNDQEVERAAAESGKWNFLFFHEYCVHGGDVGQSLFQRALGPPNPLRAKPTKLP